MEKVMQRVMLILAILLCIALTACASTTTNPVTETSLPTPSAVSVPDYSKPENWLNIPSTTEKAVDVFYLYPTAWQKVSDTDPNICEIDNPSMLKGSKILFQIQAPIFTPVANVFAPYYRQVAAAYSLTLPQVKQEQIVGDIPAGDAIAAFDYYITNYNKERPFILAGHSQGSNVLLYLLSRYMKAHPEVYKRMVAAYVIGYSVTKEYLANNPYLKFADGPDDVGVIISYNTEAPVREGNNPVVLPGAQVINPILWTRNETLATADQNLGTMLVDADYNLVSAGKFADARVDKSRGVLICSTVDVEKLLSGKGVVGKGIYHNYDYLFYYKNLSENAANRIEHYLQIHGQPTP
jgi:hypothetical protein